MLLGNNEFNHLSIIPANITSRMVGTLAPSLLVNYICELI